MMITTIGLLAALCTSLSYIPQVKKVLETRSTDDISLKMTLILATGLALWVTYGVLKKDMVIITANALSLSLLGIIIFFKMNAFFHKSHKRRA